MFLKSTLNASSISAPVAGFRLTDFFDELGEQRPALSLGEKVPIAPFIEYGLWFRDHLVPDVEEKEVCSIQAAGDGFRVTLGYVPEQLAALVPDGPACDAPVSHSSQHRDFAALAGRRVAVIGAGQSALESAALCHEAGADVVVIVRGPQVVFAGPPQPGPKPIWTSIKSPPAPLGSGWSHALLSRGYGPAAFRHLPLQARLRLVRVILGPAGAWWLRERVEDRFPVRLGERVEKATAGNGGVVLEVGGSNGTRTSLEVDHVIAATGYRVDVDKLHFLAPDIRARIARMAGWPRLSSTLECSVPGVYFTGLAAAASFGPMLRFVCGTAFAAPAVARGIQRRTG
jgi:thioredoxin reductase